MTCEHCGGCKSIGELNTQALKEELGKRASVAYALRDQFDKEHDRYRTHRLVGIVVPLLIAFALMFGWFSDRKDDVVMVAMAFVMTAMTVVIGDWFPPKTSSVKHKSSL